MRLNIEIHGRIVLLNQISRGSQQHHRSRCAEIRDEARILALQQLGWYDDIRLRNTMLRATVRQTYATNADHADVGACAPAAKSAIDGMIAAIDGVDPIAIDVDDDEKRLPEITYLYGLVTGTKGMSVTLHPWQP